MKQEEGERERERAIGVVAAAHLHTAAQCYSKYTTQRDAKIALPRGTIHHFKKGCCRKATRH